MAQNDTPRKALVLAGGGARGSYQVGVWRALTELGWNPQIITGTSVGSLNGAMFALDLYETARDMWTSIRSQDVMELPEETRNLTELHQFLRDVVRAGGMDVTPLEEIVERVLDEDALRASPIRFWLVTVEKRGLKPRELPLEEIPKGKVKDYLLASAACFPALRAKQIDGVQFLDGGYRDNMPTGLAQKMGAEELVCVDLEGVGITLPNRTGLPTTMVRSYWELGDILHFDPDTARRNIELGYYDTLRAFGRLRGKHELTGAQGHIEVAVVAEGLVGPEELGGQRATAVALVVVDVVVEVDILAPLGRGAQQRRPCVERLPAAPSLQGGHVVHGLADGRLDEGQGVGVRLRQRCRLSLKHREGHIIEDEVIERGPHRRYAAGPRDGSAADVDRHRRAQVGREHHRPADAVAVERDPARRSGPIPGGHDLVPGVGGDLAHGQVQPGDEAVDSRGGTHDQGQRARLAQHADAVFPACIEEPLWPGSGPHVAFDCEAHSAVGCLEVAPAQVVQVSAELGDLRP